MALMDSLFAAVTAPGNLKEALGAALNRCEVGTCAGSKNLSLGVKCFQCQRFTCNAHGFLPLSMVPAMVSQKRLATVCLDCLVVQAREEALPHD